VTNDEPATPAAPVPASSAPPRRLGRLLLIVVAFLVALGAVAGGALLFFYDQITGIDRSTPQVVTDQFLEATLSQRDSSRVALFVCSDWSAEQAVQAADAPTDSRVSTFWGDVTVNTVGETAIVSVRVVYRLPTGGGNIQQDTEMWTLQLERQDGWRVCGLSKDSLLEP
jgi:hypothetical protein